jgi:hypothetical protein
MSVGVNQPNLPEPGASLPPRRNRGMFLGLMAAVFLSGGVVGGGTGMLITQQKFSDCLRHPERMSARMVAMFRSELGLTEDQAKQVDEIVQRHHEQIEAIRSEVRPRFSAEWNSMHEEVKAVLTEEQRTKLEEMRERFRKDMPRSKRDRERKDRNEKNAKETTVEKDDK